MGWHQLKISDILSRLHHWYYKDIGMLPLRKGVTWVIISIEALLLIGCIVALFIYFGPLEFWAWLVILGIICFELGAYLGWFEVGVYVRAARKEQDQVKANWYRDMALHDGMRAIVSLTIGIGLFTLAWLFKSS